MKKAWVVLLALILFASLAYGVDYKKKSSHSLMGRTFDKVEIEVEDGVLIITPRDRDDIIVEITPEHELFINGEAIELNDDQQELVKEYYEGLSEIIDSAMHIGLRGAKIGVKGVMLGMSALVKMVKLLGDDYDSQDLEREIEKESKKLEAKAKRLEAEAEELEVLAERFEKTQKKFAREIKEIRELDIF